MSGDIPDFEVDGDRFLVSGYFSGILVSEFGCFLTGKLPYDWQDDLTGFENRNSQFNLDFSSAKRTISVRSTQASAYCASIKTSFLFGLKSHLLTICTERNPLLKVSIKSKYDDEDEIHLIMEDADDGN